jgi:hypothetical protein
MRFTIAVSFLAIAAVVLPNQARATLLINDDFSTFASGNLAGQNGWTQLGFVATTLPVQITGGKAVIPGAQSADNQDVWKNNSAPGGVILPPVSGTTSIFYGLDLTVQSAPVTGPGDLNPSPSYFAAVYNATGAGGFANERLTAKDNSANVPGTYLLGARITGQASDPFTFGTPLSYGTPYNVVVEADMVAPTAANDTLEIFVNGSLYMSHTIGATAADPTGMGSFVISQFASAATGNVGATIGHVRMADNFAQAAGVPEPSTLVLGCLSAVGLISIVRRNRSQS